MTATALTSVLRLAKRTPHSQLKALALFLLLLFIGTTPLQSQVVINEILYHAPDDLDQLQFIELHNSSATPVEVAGWKFSEGVQFTFPTPSTIAPGGFAVVCRNSKLFSDYFSCPVVGTFTQSIKRSGETITLQNAQGEIMDRVQFKDRAPWPVSPDGMSASLERISPAGESNSPHNWAPSNLPKSSDIPGGTPGRRNDSFQATLPAAMVDIAWTPQLPQANSPIQVKGRLENPGAAQAESIVLEYQVASHRTAGKVQSVTMTPSAQEGLFQGTIPGQPEGSLVRFRIHLRAPGGSQRFIPNPNEPRPMFTLFVAPNFPKSTLPQAYLIQASAQSNLLGEPESGLNRFLHSGEEPEPAPPLQGSCALVWVPTNNASIQVFDYIHAHPRNAGYKIHLHKDQPLDGMPTFNLLFETHERFVLAEPMAFELYQMAGNPACNTSFARLYIDDQPLGYHLLVEQPNKAFLRRNRIQEDGNLYKLIWQGQGVVGQHEKKSHRHEGHQDLIKFIRSLNEKDPDKLWKNIQSQIDVTNVATYFAVNLVLSHWDGFFNNYFIYHDRKGSKKWMMFPWDQDKTWGYHDGLRSSGLFTDLPVTYGMRGDKPPGWTRPEPPRNFFEGGTMWWRPGGWVSSPVLANPQFQKLYYATVRRILDNHYTPQKWEAKLQSLETVLTSEVEYRAGIRNENPAAAVKKLRRNIQLLRQHIQDRRAYLLAQPEIRDAQLP